MMGQTVSTPCSAAVPCNSSHISVHSFEMRPLSCISFKEWSVRLAGRAYGSACFVLSRWMHSLAGFPDALPIFISCWQFSSSQSMTGAVVDFLTWMGNRGPDWYLGVTYIPFWGSMHIMGMVFTLWTSLKCFLRLFGWLKVESQCRHGKLPAEGFSVLSSVLSFSSVKYKKATSSVNCSVKKSNVKYIIKDIPTTVHVTNHRMQILNPLH